MSEQAASGRWGFGVRISQPRLSNLEFSWDGVPEAAIPNPVKFEFSMGFQRFSVYELGVEFRATLEEVPDLTASAAYRVTFALDPESPEGREPEKALRQIAARMAPVTLYPFCREALVSTAQRAGLLNVNAPISNVGLLWEPGELDIPAPDEDGDEEKG
jgi:hypothetical protein